MHRIVHIMRVEKFNPGFIDLVERHFDASAHSFFLKGSPGPFVPAPRANLYVFHQGRRLAKFLRLLREIQGAERIIIHGLFGSALLFFLMLQPWVLPKCFWVIWGGDLYKDKLKKRKSLAVAVRERMRRFVVPRIGYLVTHVAGDVERARQWYGARGLHEECFVYPSNLFPEALRGLRENPLRQTPLRVVNILVGNSADPSNHHLEVLQKLAALDGPALKLHVPLSYGNHRHRDRVIQEGRKLFGEDFVPLLDFVPLDQYQRFLQTVDVAVFNHERQQAMGNIIILLGLGKKVFMRSDVSSWEVLAQRGVRLFDIDALDLAPMPAEQALVNQSIIQDYFCRERLVSQLGKIFGQQPKAVAAAG